MSEAPESVVRREPGHKPVNHGGGDWRCECGERLGNVPTNQERARDAMRTHRKALAHLAIEPFTARQVAALLERIVIAGECWEWSGAKVRGYGCFYYWDGTRSRSMMAHRAVWTVKVGPIPEGRELDHLCRNPSCVNPSHMEAVTPDVNKRRQGDAVTECPQGHPYTPENTAIYRNCRTCKTCRRERDIARYRRKQWEHQ